MSVSVWWVQGAQRDPFNLLIILNPFPSEYHTHTRTQILKRSFASCSSTLHKHQIPSKIRPTTLNAQSRPNITRLERTGPITQAGWSFKQFSSVFTYTQTTPYLLDVETLMCLKARNEPERVLTIKWNVLTLTVQAGFENWTFLQWLSMSFGWRHLRGPSQDERLWLTVRPSSYLPTGSVMFGDICLFVCQSRMLCRVMLNEARSQFSHIKTLHQ